MANNNNKTKAQFYQPPTPLGSLFQSFGVSHSVRIPLSKTTTWITTSGQPGFHLDKNELVTGGPSSSSSPSHREQISACFDCVEAALKAAGVEQGLAAVHKMTVFLLDMKDDGLVSEVWRERMPEHRPTWITIGAAELALPGMVVEMMADAVVWEE